MTGFGKVGMSLRPTRRITENFLRFTEKFDDPIWTKSNLTVNPDSEISPNLELTADKLVENNINATHQIFQITDTGAPLANRVFSLSCYAKAAERTQLTLSFSSANASIARFDLTTELVFASLGQGGGDAPLYSGIQNVGDGWYRLLMISKMNSFNGSANLYSAVRMTNGGIDGYLGDGLSGIFIYGMNALESSTIFPYQPKE